MSTLPAPSLAAQPGLFSPRERGPWWSAAGKLRRSLGSRMGYALADQVVYSFGNMVVAAMLSRHCAQREFGVYILTQRSMDVLIQLCNVFLWGPFTFNLPGTTDDRKPVYEGSIFTLQLTACALFTGLLWLASRWAATPSRAVYLATFMPLVLTSGGILFREYTRRIYFACMRLKEAFWTDVATVSLQIAGAEWLFRTGRLDVPHVLAVLWAGASLVSVWWLAHEARRLTLNLRATREDLRLNLRLGRWFLGSNMVFLASSQCNPWVLSAFSGGAAVGAYSICESVVNIPRVALTSMQNIMGPMVARASNEGGRLGLRAAVRRLDRTLLMGSAIFAALICVAGPWAARIIFRAAPGNARTVLVLLSLNLVAYAAALAQSYGLTALDRADTTFYANALGLLVQAAICFVLVRRFQVPGAAAAMLLGSVVVLAARSLYFRREMTCP